MGNQQLTHLWNTCPDSKEEYWNTLPSLEAYLDGSKEKQDPLFEWRALRFLARQSPLFYRPSHKVAGWRAKIQNKMDVKQEVVKEDVPSQNENEAEGEGVEEEETDQMVLELLKTEQLTPEDKNTCKTIELAPSIGKDWKKLANMQRESSLKIEKNINGAICTACTTRSDHRPQTKFQQQQLHHLKCDAQIHDEHYFSQSPKPKQAPKQHAHHQQQQQPELFKA